MNQSRNGGRTLTAGDQAQLTRNRLMLQLSRILIPFLEFKSHKSRKFLKRHALKACRPYAPLDLVAFLKKAKSVMSTWPDDVLDSMVRQGRVRYLLPNEFLVFRGEPSFSSGVWLLLDGEVILTDTPNRPWSPEAVTKRLTAPAIIGEDWFACDCPAAAFLLTSSVADILQLHHPLISDVVQRQLPAADAAAFGATFLRHREKALSEYFPQTPTLMRHCWICRDMTDDQINRLILSLKPLSLMPGKEIVVQDTFTPVMYFLRRGTVAIYERGYDTGRRLKPGSSFGETAVIFGEKRMASVISVTITDVWVLHRKDFTALLRHHDELKASVIQRAAQARVGWLRDMKKIPQNPLLKALRTVPFLAHCGEDTFQELIDVAEPRVFPAGNVMSRTCAQCDGLYVIVRGNAKTQLKFEAGSSQTYSALDYFGEWCLVAHRWATCIFATTITDTWRISAKSITKILRARGEYDTARAVCESAISAFMRVHGEGSILLGTVVASMKPREDPLLLSGGEQSDNATSPPKAAAPSKLLRTTIRKPPSKIFVNSEPSTAPPSRAAQRQFKRLASEMVSDHYVFTLPNNEYWEDLQRSTARAAALPPVKPRQQAASAPQQQAEGVTGGEGSGGHHRHPDHLPVDHHDPAYIGQDRISAKDSLRAAADKSLIQQLATLPSHRHLPVLKKWIETDQKTQIAAKRMATFGSDPRTGSIAVPGLAGGTPQTTTTTEPLSTLRPQYSEADDPTETGSEDLSVTDNAERRNSNASAPGDMKGTDNSMNGAKDSDVKGEESTAMQPEVTFSEITVEQSTVVEAPSGGSREREPLGRDTGSMGNHSTGSGEAGTTDGAIKPTPLDRRFTSRRGTQRRVKRILTLEDYRPINPHSYAAVVPRLVVEKEQARVASIRIVKRKTTLAPSDIGNRTQPNEIASTIIVLDDIESNRKNNTNKKSESGMVAPHARGSPAGSVPMDELDANRFRMPTIEASEELVEELFKISVKEMVDMVAAEFEDFDTDYLEDAWRTETMQEDTTANSGFNPFSPLSPSGRRNTMNRSQRSIGGGGKSKSRKPGGAARSTSISSTSSQPAAAEKSAKKTPLAEDEEAQGSQASGNRPKVNSAGSKSQRTKNSAGSRPVSGSHTDSKAAPNETEEALDEQLDIYHDEGSSHSTDGEGEMAKHESGAGDGKKDSSGATPQEKDGAESKKLKKVKQKQPKKKHTRGEKEQETVLPQVHVPRKHQQAASEPVVRTLDLAQLSRPGKDLRAHVIMEDGGRHSAQGKGDNAKPEENAETSARKPAASESQASADPQSVPPAEEEDVPVVHRREPAPPPRVSSYLQKPPVLCRIRHTKDGICVDARPVSSPRKPNQAGPATPRSDAQRQDPATGASSARKPGSASRQVYPPGSNPWETVSARRLYFQRLARIERPGSGSQSARGGSAGKKPSSEGQTANAATETPAHDAAAEKKENSSAEAAPVGGEAETVEPPTSEPHDVPSQESPTTEAPQNAESTPAQ